MFKTPFRSLAFDQHSVFAYDERGNSTLIVDPAEAKALRLLGSHGLIPTQVLDAEWAQSA